MTRLLTHGFSQSLLSAPIIVKEEQVELSLLKMLPREKCAVVIICAILSTKTSNKKRRIYGHTVDLTGQLAVR